METWKSKLWLALGSLFLIIGVIGIFIPLLPTTPFLLLASLAFSRGSQRLHRWLLNHPRLGPPVHDWQDHGVIRPRAKVLAVSLIVISLSWPLLFLDLSVAVKATAGAVGLGCVAFLVSRPSAPRADDAAARAGSVGKG